MPNFFDLSAAQRSAIYDLIGSFGLDVSASFAATKSLVEFVAEPTDDGIGYSSATNACAAALLAVCGAPGFSVYRESSPSHGGRPFRDGLRRIIAVEMKREPFPGLSQYGKGI